MSTEIYIAYDYIYCSVHSFGAQIENMPHHSLTAIIKQVNQQQWRKKTTKKNRIIDILPYENTYGQYYYPDQLVTIEQTMIDKIVHGVQAMATALTNSVNRTHFLY